MVNSQGLPAPGPCSHSGPRGWKPLAIFPCPLWGREQTAQHQNPPARSNPRGPPLQARPQAVPPLRRDRWDGVLRIMRPRTSEIPPVLSRNRSLAPDPPPYPPPQRGEGNHCAARANSATETHVVPRALRGGSARLFNRPGQAESPTSVATATRALRARRSPADYCKPAHKPSPPYQGGQGRSRPSVFSSRVSRPPASMQQTATEIKIKIKSIRIRGPRPSPHDCHSPDLALALALALDRRPAGGLGLDPADDVIALAAYNAHFFWVVLLSAAGSLNSVLVLLVRMIRWARVTPVIYLNETWIYTVWAWIERQALALGSATARRR